MKTEKSMDKFIWHKGELLAELFLQDLNPSIIARPTADFGYDFIVGFQNVNGGINSYAIEVKATERPVGSTYYIDAKKYTYLSNSNIPALLLVIDVKENKIFYSWIIPHAEKVQSSTIAVPVIEITDAVKKELQQQLQSGLMEQHLTEPTEPMISLKRSLSSNCKAA